MSFSDLWGPQHITTVGYTDNLLPILFITVIPTFAICT